MRSLPHSKRIASIAGTFGIYCEGRAKHERTVWAECTVLQLTMLVTTRITTTVLLNGYICDDKFRVQILTESLPTNCGPLKILSFHFRPLITPNFNCYRNYNF